MLINLHSHHLIFYSPSYGQYSFMVTYNFNDKMGNICSLFNIGLTHSLAKQL